MVYTAAAVLGSIGAVIALGLLVALRRLKTEENEKVELLTQMLPGANCGACGAASCGDMAQALASGEKNIGLCPFTSPNVSARIAEILDSEVSKEKRKVAQVLCQGRSSVASNRAEYQGLQDCWAAEAVTKGGKGCTYGCLGLGSCVTVCPVGAIKVPKDGVAEIDTSLCTGCGMCVESCPRGVIEMVQEGTKALPRCVSVAPPKVVRSVCEVGCITCKKCERVCPTDACKVIGGRVIIDPDLCDGCGLCAENCPTGVIDMGIQDEFKVPVIRVSGDDVLVETHCSV